MMSRLPLLLHFKSPVAAPTKCRVSIWPSIATVCRELWKELLHPYRPELHYMRGPGPRSREKQAVSSPDRGYTRANVQDPIINASGTPPRPGARGRPPSSRAGRPFIGGPTGQPRRLAT